jgi:ankyrin repeat protein
MRIAMFAENGYEKELLHFAAQHGDLSQIERLIAEGSDVNAFDCLGMTPLLWAAKGEHLNVVAFLIKNGADVNAHHEPSIGDTALGAVAGNCSFEMARVLVDAGADPSIRGWMQLNALDRAKERKRGDGPRVYALLTEAAGRRRS